MRWLDGITQWTQWTWVWVISRSWWWTGRPGMLQSMGSQRVGHDWVTDCEYKMGDIEVNTQKTEGIRLVTEALRSKCWPFPTVVLTEELSKGSLSYQTHHTAKSHSASPPPLLLPQLIGMGMGTKSGQSGPLLQTRSSLNIILWRNDPSLPPLSCCSVAKSCPTLGPHGLWHARLLCPPVSPGVCSDSCPLNPWCYLTISSSVAPFSSCLLIS